MYLLDSAAAAKIHTREDSYADQLRTLLTHVAPSICDVHYGLRDSKGHVVILAESEVEPCVEILKAATFAVTDVQHFDWTGDNDFDHDHEWLVSFEVQP